MIMNFLIAQAEGGPIQQIAETFGVDWPHLIAQMISFSIVCALLYRFAYKPVLAMLDKRRQRIAESLADAEKIKAELARATEQHREMMVQANQQAMELLEEARAVAARVGQQESQKAIAAAEQILVRAREASARDHERMMAELKREVGRLVVQATAAVTGKILTEEDQRRLAEEAAQEIPA